MKAIILATLVLGMGTVSAADTTPTFKCSNKVENVSVTYQMGDTPNSSTMKYSHGKLKFRAEATEEATVLGNLVSSRVASLSIPDKETFYVTMVVPRVNFKAEVTKVNFNTTVIETKSATSIAGENGVTGIIQRSRYFFVNCTGSVN